MIDREADGSDSLEAQSEFSEFLFSLSLDTCCKLFVLSTGFRFKSFYCRWHGYASFLRSLPLDGLTLIASFSLAQVRGWDLFFWSGSVIASQRS